MSVCPNCNKENPDDFKFCQACGTPLAKSQPQSVSCPRCNSANPQGMKFCKDCGAPLSDEPQATAPPAAAAPAPAAAPSPSGVNCASCGGVTPSGFKFCQHCGNPLPTTPPNAAKTPADPAANASLPSNAGQQPGAEVASTLMDIKSDDNRAPALTPPAGMPPGQKDDSDKTVGPGAGIAPADSAKPAKAQIIVVHQDGSDGPTHAISEDMFDVGRNAGHLTFTHDLYLNARHCRFIKKADGWYIQDLDSINGVYQRFLEGRALSDQDTLLFGKQFFFFERIDDKEHIQPGIQHGVMVLGSPLNTVWGRLSQMTIAGVHRDIYYLDRPQTTFGREDCDIIFPEDEFMSRKHMAISFVDNNVLIRDLGSSNGTFLKIRQESKLASGDMLRLGDQLLRFEDLA